ncbi:MAG: HAMP domain-containing sensor histidine kinase [Kofleriaceae bacterium]
MATEAKAPGTRMAHPQSVPTNDAVWRNHRDQYFIRNSRKTSRVMNGLGCLVFLGMVAILWDGGYPHWRILAAICLNVGFIGGHRLVIHTTHSQGRVEQAFIKMNVMAQLFVVGMAGLTGGVHSPFIPATLIPAIVSLLFFGPQSVSRWIALGNGLFIVAMASLPREVVGPALPDSHFALAIMIQLAWNLFMLHMLVGKLSAIAAETSDEFDSLREERLGDAEAQLRRLQSVGAKVAHELKNPLASIKGLCQLVARTPESERTQERLAVVASEISRMETILGEYLSFSRPLEDLKPQKLDVTELSRDVLEVLAGRADQGGVSLALEGAGTKVEGDPRRLKEALINLVSNAIEATPNGGNVTLRVKNGGPEAIVEVEDTGRGISAEDLNRLGTSFFTTRPNGTGLGVVLAQSVITQHGGTLTYKSTIGRGTCATIKLPCSATLAPSLDGRAAMVEARA